MPNFISLGELNPHNYPTTDEVAANLKHLLECLNKVRDAYGQPMRITSGLRSDEDQQRINPSAPKSKHLTGQAADVSDPDGKFWAWCMTNMDLFVALGLYFEDKKSTPTWVHLQTTPPRSGKRIFIP